MPPGIGEAGGPSFPRGVGEAGGEVGGQQVPECGEGGKKGPQTPREVEPHVSEGGDGGEMDVLLPGERVAEEGGPHVPGRGVIGPLLSEEGETGGRLPPTRGEGGPQGGLTMSG